MGGRRRDRFDDGALGLPHFLLRCHFHEFQVRGVPPALLQGAQETSERRLIEVLWRRRDRFNAAALGLPHFLLRCHFHELQVRGASPTLWQRVQETSERRWSEMPHCTDFSAYRQSPGHCMQLKESGDWVQLMVL